MFLHLVSYDLQSPLLSFYAHCYFLQSVAYCFVYHFKEKPAEIFAALRLPFVHHVLPHVPSQEEAQSIDLSPSLTSSFLFFSSLLIGVLIEGETIFCLHALPCILKFCLIMFPF